ncbi:MAG: hypothetical protein KDD49_05745 [Bacteroidetes bacterium]|nr:hypothetical protein [Bacteroidota bacterium]
MKQLETQQEYLYRHGVGKDTPAEQVAKLKQAYRKLYRKAYHEENKPETVTLYLTKEEKQLLFKHAKKHHLKLATFAREAVLAYVQQQYVVPDKEQYHDLIAEINAIGHNINQVVRLMHLTGQPAQYYDQLRIQFAELEAEVTEFTGSPPSLDEFLRTALQDPDRKDFIIEQLKQLIHDYQEQDEKR